MNKRIIDCPRCLGKGHVNKEDIKRLRREYFWIEGPHCAYCDGKKQVNFDFANKVNADEWFLTSDVDQQEIQRFLNGDQEIINSVRQHEDYINYLANYLMENYVSRAINKDTIIERLCVELQSTKSEIKPIVNGLIEQIKINLLDSHK